MRRGEDTHEEHKGKGDSRKGKQNTFTRKIRNKNVDLNMKEKKGDEAKEQRE